MDDTCDPGGLFTPTNPPRSDQKSKSALKLLRVSGTDLTSTRCCTHWEPHPYSSGVHGRSSHLLSCKPCICIVGCLQFNGNTYNGIILGFIILSRNGISWVLADSLALASSQAALFPKDPLWPLINRSATLFVCYDIFSNVMILEPLIIWNLVLGRQRHCLIKSDFLSVYARKGVRLLHLLEICSILPIQYIEEGMDVQILCVHTQSCS